MILWLFFLSAYQTIYVSSSVSFNLTIINKLKTCDDIHLYSDQTRIQKVDCRHCLYHVTYVWYPPSRREQWLFWTVACDYGITPSYINERERGGGEREREFCIKFKHHWKVDI